MSLAVLGMLLHSPISLYSFLQIYCKAIKLLLTLKITNIYLSFKIFETLIASNKIIVKKIVRLDLKNSLPQFPFIKKRLRFSSLGKMLCFVEENSVIGCLPHKYCRINSCDWKILSLISFKNISPIK